MLNSTSGDVIANAASMLLRSIRRKSRLTSERELTGAKDTEFAQLDSYVKAVDRTIEAITNALKLHRCHSAAQRNTLVPLAQLPTEVLSYIVSLVLSDYESDFRLRLQNLYQLRSVSKLFRDIVNNTPYIWTSITSTCPMHVVSEALTRSGNLPLAIHGQDELEEPDQRLPTNSDFLDAVLAHANRWEEAFLEFPSPPALQEALCMPAPRLKNLRLRTHYYPSRAEEFRTALEIFGDQVGQLDSLQLYSVRLRWDSSIIRGLKWLRIDSHLPFPDPSPDTILQILSSSPNLRGLSLSYMACNSAISPLNSRPVLLNDLEELDLYFPDSHILAAILSHVVAPSCVVVRVTARMNATRAISFAEQELLPKFPALHSAILASQSSELILGKSESRIVVWRSSSIEPGRKHAEMALEVGDLDETKTDYSSTFQVLLADDTGSRTTKLRLCKRFLAKSQWSNHHVQSFLTTRRQITGVEIDLPGENDMDIHILFDNALWTEGIYATFPSMASLFIRGSAWSSDSLFRALNDRAVNQHQELTGLRLFVHESTEWDEDDYDLLWTCEGVESVEWVTDEDEEIAEIL